jgi:hypothetical protein
MDLTLATARRADQRHFWVVCPVYRENPDFCLLISADFRRRFVYRECPDVDRECPDVADVGS